MATLVLSTVGTALGGPVGGAIGALIGQSFDKQLLSPASRGPRLGDLSVQTSSYGTQVPRIYGTMRVAGSVIWATDLVESGETTGAKGQPDVTYSYSVSLAVALSSRPVNAIGRIWADGKLLRGAEGDFKVPTTFRFYDGGEGQQVDPLIASAEGIENTPAYRGLAMAVFEDLELAEYGNRIPFLTFEVIADAGPVEVCSILADASADAIGSTVDATVGGYAAYGASIASALQPLIDCFDVPLFDDGSVLRAPIDAGSLKISDDELGNSADAKAVSRITREQLPARGVPSTLRLIYYDAERDYQTGEARASAGGQDRNEEREELAAVLSAGDAKMLAQQMLARQWASRDRLTLRLPPSRLGLEPGSLLETGPAPASWIIEKSTLEGFVSIVELRPAWQTTDTVPADAGRIVANMDVVAGPTVLALIDAPKLEPVTSEPTLLIAASSASQGWRSRPVTLTCSGERLETRTSAKKSVLGRTASVLGEAPSSEIDETNTVDIELIDAEQWLTSCDRDALATGRNLAVVGSEILQFAIATPLGQGRFRLESLLRGRGGTEWATSAHVSGELFCLLDLASLRPQPVPRWMRGANVSAADAHGGTASIVLSAGSSGVIASPSGGAVADSEARTAIDAILNALREQGLIEG